MQYVIYQTKSAARFRRWLLTGDSRKSGFIGQDEEYEQVINHPTLDKAAIPIVINEPVYYQDLPTQKQDFSVFFTDMEKATAVDSLPDDWNTIETN